MNAKIDKFFTQRILNEFRMTEEDAVGVKEIIRRFLIFEAKETVEELEKEEMPRAKRSRFSFAAQETPVQSTSKQTETPARSFPVISVPDQPEVNELANFLSDTNMAYMGQYQAPQGLQVQQIQHQVPLVTPPPVPAQSDNQRPQEDDREVYVRSPPEELISNGRPLCPICFVDFADLRALRKHLTTNQCIAESQEMAYYTCNEPDCSKKNSQWYTQKKNIELHHINEHTPKSKGGRPKKTVA